MNDAVVPLMLSLLALAAIVAFLVWAPREKFIPFAPSKTGDQKAVTPAGNVILY